MMEATASTIKQARAADLPLVIDADGLWLVQQQPDLISGYEKAILTPNAAEFNRLCEALSVPDDLQALCWSLGNVTIIQKGKVDRASDGTIVITCDEPGSYRRCGGQGDVLAGTLATFLNWAYAFKEADEAFSRNLLAATAASTITRRCAKLAFSHCGRSTTTPDLIANIAIAMEEFFPCGSEIFVCSPSPKRSPTSRPDEALSEVEGSIAASEF